MLLTPYLFRVLTDRTEQLFFTEWFGQILIRPNNTTFGFIKQAVFTRQHDDWGRLKLGIIFDQGAGLIAVQSRHHDIDENNIRVGIGDFSQGIETVSGCNDFAAAFFSRVSAVRRIVLLSSITMTFTS